MIRFACPGCFQKLQASHERAGQMLPCPFCGQVIYLSLSVTPVPVAGIASFLAAALTLGLTAVLAVIQDGWDRHVVTGAWPVYRTFAGMDLSDLPDMLAKVNVAAVILMVAGLAAAGFSFLGAAKKHWSWMGLAGNGMLLLWKLAAWHA